MVVFGHSRWRAREESMRQIEKEFVGRTYDDFLVRPQRGVVDTRRDVALTSRLSRRIELALPLVSANMDSVTGPEMAKTMALRGGIGIVHRALSIEAQAEAIQRVK